MSQAILTRCHAVEALIKQSFKMRSAAKHYCNANQFSLEYFKTSVRQPKFL